MEMSSPNDARLRRVIVAPIVVLAATVFTGTAAAQDDDDYGFVHCDHGFHEHALHARQAEVRRVAEFAARRARDLLPHR